MRAVLIKDGKGPVENLYIGEAPKPTPGQDEVLVKAGLSHFVESRSIFSRLIFNFPFLDSSIRIE